MNERQVSERSYADKEELKDQGETRDQVGLLINCNDSIFTLSCFSLIFVSIIQSP